MTVRKNNLMYKLYGINAEHHCKDCNHLITYRPTDKTFYKCECYGVTGSEASDWRTGCPACGLYNKPYTGNPVIKMVKPEKEETIIEGQMSINDFI